MSTATKLEYLNDTKQLLKENINNLGGNLTTEPFRQYASVLEGIYERLPKISGIGASLSLSPSMVGKIKLNEIQGNTLQNGTPTPSSPVPIQSVTGLQNVEVCGKNLINGLLDNSTTGKKLERTINADENFYLYIKTNNTTSDRCYAFSDNTNVGTIWVSNNNGTLTFSGSRNFTFNRIRIQDNTTVSENMLTLGSATTYEPYKGNTYEVNLGKNLLDITDGTYSNNGITAVASNGEITLNGTASATSFVTIPLLSNISLGSTNKTLSLNNSKTISDTSTECRLYTSGQDYNSVNFSTINKSITFSNDRVYTRLQIRTSSGVTYNDFVFKPQLEKGSQATSYSPYFTPIELNKIGDYEDSIKKSTGKNLVYEIEQGSFNYQTGAFSTNANIIRTKKIPVTPNTTYTISSKLALGECCTYFYENDSTTGIAGSLLISTTTVKSISFTTPNNAYYMIFRLGASSVPYSATDDNNIMLNEGSTALPYEPYGKVWYIEKNIGKVVLNGSETYDVAGTNTSGKYKIRYDGVVNLIKRPANAGTIGDIISNQFIPLSANYTYRCNQGISVETNGKISFYDETITQSTSAFTTWLASNNMTIKYALATPEYETITNTELIEQLETLSKAKSKNGTTNIVITSQDLAMLMDVSVIKGDA